MDYERNDIPPQFSSSHPSSEDREPPGQPPAAGPPPYQPPPRERKRFSPWRVFWGVLFGLSLLANVGMFLMLIGLTAVVMTGQAGPFQEVVVRDGPASDKIVMVNVTGMIHGEQAEKVYRQLKEAAEDNAVKGILLAVNSPGGTISGSDRIYKEVLRFSQNEGVPVVAFMQGVAASGGYYVSVACDKIVAEPTAITGSIGVIMGHFVFEELLENKLGIQPVFLTEGEKKNWPSSFHAPKQEELDYLRERLLKPAYDRFVEVIEEGRQDVLSPSEVREVADGSIYVAPQALDAKLIDEVGYLDDAIDAAKSLAGLGAARVVEYRRPFSWTGFLNAQSKSVFKLDRMKLYELSTPEMLYLWSVHAQ